MPNRPEVNLLIITALATTIVAGAFPLLARGEQQGSSKLVSVGADGKLKYAPDARGNLVPDYSYAGYMGGGVALPQAPVKVTLKPQADAKDDSPRIQAAIDQVQKLAPDAHGIRGAVLLEKGQYNLARPLKITAGGVVLRGEGDGEDGTVLRGTMREKCTLISIAGAGELVEISGSRHQITDARVPVGAKTFSVDSASELKAGDQVMVVRNTNEKWVHEVGMDNIPLRPADPKATKQWPTGPREAYDRTIVAIGSTPSPSTLGEGGGEGSVSTTDHSTSTQNPHPTLSRNTGRGENAGAGAQVTLDAPLYNDFTKDFGGGFVYAYSFPGRIAQCGVENLRAESLWTKGTGPLDGKGNKTADDLRHSDHFIVIDNAENCWVRDCACVDFLQGGVWVERNARNVTIADCYYEVPNPKFNYYVDEPHGETSRYAFCMIGQGNLVLRCSGKYARHTFMTQSMAAGPNVFLDCDALTQHNVSETHHRWATGVLFDCIGQNHPTSLMSANRAWMGSGHGWSGAYVMMWNCVGDPLICEIPPTASNWAVGCTGKRDHGPFNKEIVTEAYESWGAHAQPASLYRAQLRDRLGEDAVRNAERHALAASASGR